MPLSQLFLYNFLVFLSVMVEAGEVGLVGKMLQLKSVESHRWSEKCFSRTDMIPHVMYDIGTVDMGSGQLGWVIMADRGDSLEVGSKKLVGAPLAL